MVHEESAGFRVWAVGLVCRMQGAEIDANGQGFRVEVWRV